MSQMELVMFPHTIFSGGVFLNDSPKCVPGWTSYDSDWSPGFVEMADLTLRCGAETFRIHSQRLGEGCTLVSDFCTSGVTGSGEIVLPDDITTPRGIRLALYLIYKPAAWAILRRAQPWEMSRLVITEDFWEAMCALHFLGASTLEYDRDIRDKLGIVVMESHLGVLGQGPYREGQISFPFAARLFGKLMTPPTMSVLPLSRDAARTVLGHAAAHFSSSSGFPREQALFVFSNVLPDFLDPLLAKWIVPKEPIWTKTVEFPYNAVPLETGTWDGAGSHFLELDEDETVGIETVYREVLYEKGVDIGIHIFRYGIEPEDDVEYRYVLALWCTSRVAHGVVFSGTLHGADFFGAVEIGRDLVFAVDLDHVKMQDETVVFSLKADCVYIET